MLLLAVQAVTLGAQEKISRPIRQEYRIETGGGYLRDAYLTPLKYSGVELALSGEWSKAIDRAGKIDMTFAASVGSMLTRNMARNAHEYNLDVDFSWGVRRGWRLPCGVTLAAGGGPYLSVNADYMPRNGNNPVSAQGAVGVFVTGYVSRTWHIGRMPLRVADKVWLPSLSLIAQQQYGESYYEISLGNTRGLLHAGWWGNNFRIDNHLTVTFGFLRGELTAGYRFKVRSSYVGYIDRQRVSHAFTLGWSPTGCRACANEEDTRRITTIY